MSPRGSHPNFQLPASRWIGNVIPTLGIRAGCEVHGRAVTPDGMARKLRLEYPGACYHVINRGNYRRALFDAPGAAAAFERSLAEACERFKWRVHAFIIMRNHFHLALETLEPNLSAGMKHLQGTWAMRYNRFRHITGRPFQGRYRGIHVEPGHAFAQVAHYIHLNPVRARIVSVQRLSRFRWSSLWWFAARRTGKRPAWLSTETVLQHAGGLVDGTPGWSRYLQYLAFLAATSPQQRAEKYSEISRGWAIGTADFKERLVELLRTNGANLNAAARAGENPGDRQRLRESIWDKKLVAAARLAGISLADLSPKRSAPEKVLLAACLKSTTDVSNRWLAERLGMGAPDSAGEFARRLIRTGGSRQLRELVLAIGT